MSDTMEPPPRRVYALAARVAPPVALLILLLAAWEIFIRSGGVDAAIVPPPSDVATVLRDDATTLLSHATTTLAETGIGLVLGAVFGLLTAVLVTTSVVVRRAVEPLLVLLQTIPPIVLAPILVLALGFGWAPRIVVVVLIVFFPVAIAAAGAFLGQDQDRVDLVRSFGGSRLDVFRSVTFPGGLPAIFDGLRISAAYSVAGAAIAEQIGGARSGLGLFIARSQRSFRADQVMAGVVVVAVLSLVIYAAIGAAARAATPWHQASRRTHT